MTGKLFGVGLGPGDPELMTLKAARLIGNAQVIAYPTLAGADSFARQIAADHIAPNAIEIRIDLEMSTARAPAQHAYDAGAVEIATHLRSGRDVVVLCEGDPFFYGSFMYLHARLASEFTVQVVPGVTSMTACAAVSAVPLAARNECVTILPAPMDEKALVDRLGQTDTAVIMKIGRHLPNVRRALAAAGLTDHAVYIERATLETQVTLPLVEAPEKAPYFSMILVTKGADPWL